jgi:hypothetical protein
MKISITHSNNKLQTNGKYAPKSHKEKLQSYKLSNPVDCKTFCFINKEIMKYMAMNYRGKNTG